MSGSISIALFLPSPLVYVYAFLNSNVCCRDSIRASRACTLDKFKLVLVSISSRGGSEVGRLKSRRGCMFRS